MYMWLSREWPLLGDFTGALTHLLKGTSMTACPITPLLARRDLLIAGFGLTAAITLSGCSGALSPGSQRSNTPKGKEAPSLAELVESGDLPSVESRLPKTPVVVAAPEVGQYGGTWNSATYGSGDSAWWWRVSGYEPLVRIDPNTGVPGPNAAESFEVNQDGTSFTFKLVDGIKWSDGEPFTADDVLFWWEDYATNTDIAPEGPPGWMVVNGKPGKVTKTDDLTVVFSFDEPNGFLPLRLSDADGTGCTAMPKHYLSQFHTDFADDVDEKAKQAGLNSWVDLFLGKAGQATSFFANGLPGIRPWNLTSDLGTDPTVAFSRNPYYWKVDREGSQLPYLDAVSLAVISDAQVILLKATNGELDYHARHFNVPSNKPVVAESADRSGYHLTTLVPGSMNVGVIGLNMTIKDPIKRKIYRNKDFRIGLSYALDRQQLIDSVLQRQGEPWQAAPQRESRYADEEMGTQYVDFDLDKANEHLDRAFPKKDGDGMRLGPDGKPIVIRFLASTLGGDLEALYLEMQPIMKQQWEKVGIQMSTTAMERSLFQVKTENEEQDALMWTGFGGNDLTLPLDPRWYIPYTTSQSNWAKQWVLWNSTGGQSGEEPPNSIKEGYALYRAALAAVDADDRDAKLKQMLQLAKRDFWVIGTISTPPSYAVVSDKFKNVAETQPDCWPFPQPGQLHSETFWLSS